MLTVSQYTCTLYMYYAFQLHVHVVHTTKVTPLHSGVSLRTLPHGGWVNCARLGMMETADQCCYIRFCLGEREETCPIAAQSANKELWIGIDKLLTFLPFSVFIASTPHLLFYNAPAFYKYVLQHNRWTNIILQGTLLSLTK